MQDEKTKEGDEIDIYVILNQQTQVEIDFT